jgi:hypothetical protein
MRLHICNHACLSISIAIAALTILHKRAYIMQIPLSLLLARILQSNIETKTINKHLVV